MSTPTKPTSRADIDVIVIGIFRAISDIIESPQQRGLRGKLERIASIIEHLPGIKGALVVAFDEEGIPLTSGCSDSLLSTTSSTEHGTLSNLHRHLASKLQNSGWSEIDGSYFSLDTKSKFWALLIRSIGGPTTGLIVARCSEPEPPATFQALVDNLPLLSMAIHSFIRDEAWDRIERLQVLVRQMCQPPSHQWELQGLVDQLAKLFCADATTILLAEQSQLLLAATTDNKLVPTDRIEEYLTEHVFTNGKRLRIGNVHDFEEITEATGINNVKLKELGNVKEFPTTQFLGVPILFGNKIAGVLRMLRKGGAVRFSWEDEKALQSFSDFLGPALAHSWWLLLSKSILDSVAEAIIVSRLEQSDSRITSSIVMANAGVAKLLRREPAEIEGSDARAIYGPGAYEDICTDLAQAISEAKANGLAECGPLLTQVNRADGAVIPIVISYRILTNRLFAPPTIYAIGFARDASESERSAEQHKRFLELLDSLGIAYFRIDQTGQNQESSLAESTITGYSIEELKSINRDELYAAPQIRSTLLAEARRHQGQLTRKLQPMLRKDGSRFWAEGDLLIIKDSSGREIGVEGFYRDVTERVMLQRFLNEESQELISEDELFATLKKEAAFNLDYLTSLGHQLLTPLGSLIQTLRNFEGGILNPHQLKDRLPYVIGQAVVCIRLVRNLSYMDQILRGEPFTKEMVSLAKLAIETKLDFSHLFREKNLELVIESGGLDRNLRIQGHREMLRQVIVNMIDNAIKYSRIGSTIRVRGMMWPQGPTLEISNEGISIPQEDREKIFQRGFRSRTAKALIPHGTGFGLWLVRKILEAHEASISYSETVENGVKRNVFSLTFSHQKSSFRRMT